MRRHAHHPCPLYHRYKVELEEGFDNILVVDGVPVIDKSKLEKLLAKISKEFGKKGAHIKPDDIFVPWDDNAGKSKGYDTILFPRHMLAERDGTTQICVHGVQEC